MNEAPPTGRANVFRWVVGVVIVCALAFVGYAVYKSQLGLSDAAVGGPSTDKRVDGFIADGDQQMVNGDLEAAKEQYLKASGLADRDPRVSRGLARVEITRAELAWWAWLAAVGEESAQSEKARATLTEAVRRAEQAIDDAVSKAPSNSASRQLALDRIRLEAMVIYALARAGKKEAAKAALDKLAASHRAHPMLDSLRSLVESASKPPEPEPEPDAGTEPDAGKPRPRGLPTSEHFEFDHEPIPPVKTPGELEFPANPDPPDLAP